MIKGFFKLTLSFVLLYMAFMLLYGIDMTVNKTLVTGIYIVCGLAIGACIAAAAYYTNVAKGLKDKKKLIVMGGAVLLMCQVIFTPYNAYAEDQLPICTDSRDKACPRCVSYNTNEASIPCWPCSIYEYIFDAMDTITIRVYEALATPLLAMMTIVLAIWIIFETLMYVISFRDRGIEHYFTSVGTVAVKSALAAGVLVSGISLFSVFITPIVAAAADYASAATSDLAGRCEPTIIDNSVALGGGIKQKLFCMIKNMFIEVQTGLDVGSAIICASRENGDTEIWPFGIRIPNMRLLIFGILFWLAHAVVMVIFPVYVLDAVFKLCFFLMMFPFVIAMWPFDVFKKVSERIMSVLFNALMTFIVLSVMIKIITTLFAALAGSLEVLIQICANNKIVTAINQFEGGSLSNGILMPAIYAFGFGLLAWNIIQTAPAVAMRLTGGMDLGAKRTDRGDAAALVGATVLGAKTFGLNVAGASGGAVESGGKLTESLGKLISKGGEKLATKFGPVGAVGGVLMAVGGGAITAVGKATKFVGEGSQGKTNLVGKAGAKLEKEGGKLYDSGKDKFSSGGVSGKVIGSAAVVASMPVLAAGKVGKLLGDKVKDEEKDKKDNDKEKKK